MHLIISLIIPNKSYAKAIIETEFYAFVIQNDTKPQR